MITGRSRRLFDLLWAQDPSAGSATVYAVLDGARDEQIASWLRSSGLEHDCVYEGTLSDRLRQAAPFVVRLDREDAQAGELLGRGWGRSWGIFASTAVDLPMAHLVEHLRTLVRVVDDAERTLVFRFYDPRVLRVYLPTCTAEEAAQVFGPMQALFAESEDGNSLVTFRRASDGVAGAATPL